MEKREVTCPKHLFFWYFWTWRFFLSATFHVLFFDFERLLLNLLRFTLSMKKEAVSTTKTSRNMFGTQRHHLCQSCFPLQPSSEQNLGCLLYKRDQSIQWSKELNKAWDKNPLHAPIRISEVLRFSCGWLKQIFSPKKKSGQIIATSHDLNPNGGLVRELPLFQGNLGWWNIIIWSEKYTNHHLIQIRWTPVAVLVIGTLNLESALRMASFIHPVWKLRGVGGLGESLF